VATILNLKRRDAPGSGLPGLDVGLELPGALTITFMTRYLPFLITILALGGLVALLAGTRNGMAEFCTTRAYGWPFAMHYDYCPCGTMMGNDPAPKWAMIANGILVVLVGTLVQGMTGMGRGKRQSVGGALSAKPQQR